MTSILKDIAKVWVNEYKLVFSDVGAMIFIIFLPLAYPILYSLIYNREVVKEVPIVVVDECRTPMSREYARMLDATEQGRVADYAVNMQDARRRMAEREAYGIVYLPSDFSRNVGRGEQARMEAYCDMSVILRYKNIVTAITTVNSELGGKVQMGKVNQLGTLDEVMALCELDERLIPCIDFGHLNARDMGGLKTFDDYRHIFDTIENRLGADRLKCFHSHFSKIEYTVGGEKRHLTFADNIFGPDFEPVIELVAAKNCSPVIICESDGTQAEDAATMKNYYRSIVE